MAAEPQIDVDKCLDKIEYFLIDYNIEEVIKKQNFKEESANILRNFNLGLAIYQLLTKAGEFRDQFSEEQMNRYRSMIGIYNDKFIKK